jgi:hypothetical protein
MAEPSPPPSPIKGVDLSTPELVAERRALFGSPTLDLCRATGLLLNAALAARKTPAAVTDHLLAPGYADRAVSLAEAAPVNARALLAAAALVAEVAGPASLAPFLSSVCAAGEGAGPAGRFVIASFVVASIGDAGLACTIPVMESTGEEAASARGWGQGGSVGGGVLVEVSASSHRPRFPASLRHSQGSSLGSSSGCPGPIRDLTHE